jgi:hypothetical protein
VAGVNQPHPVSLKRTRVLFSLCRAVGAAQLMMRCGASAFMRMAAKADLNCAGVPKDSGYKIPVWRLAKISRNFAKPFWPYGCEAREPKVRPQHQSRRWFVNGRTLSIMDAS